MMAVLRSAPMTCGIAIVTAVVSLIVTALGLEPHAALYAGLVPARASLGFDGDVAGLVPVVLTPLTATLVHGGVFHLGMNLLMLVYTGVAAERAVGARGVAVLYVVGAYAAAFAQWLPDPQSVAPMIGASGAASAVLGAYALLYGRGRARAIGPVPARVVQAVWLAVAWGVMNLAIGAVAVRSGLNLAAAAHIGGFLAGLVLVQPLLAWRWRTA
jgi:membrane associated rhomboid family serine protease